MAETGRCLRGKWSLYHAGVLLLLYSDLMILALIVFLVAYPLNSTEVPPAIHRCTCVRSSLLCTIG